MITNNKLDKSFGPAGSFAGLTLFIAGAILSFSSLSGLALLVIGAFVGFSSSSTLVDQDKKRIKFSNNLFGIIRIGQWINVEPGMKIGIKRHDSTWRTYSRSNRTLDTTSRDYRIMVYDSKNKEIMPLTKTDSSESAIAEAETISKQLGLSVI